MMSTVIQSFDLKCPENLQRILRGKYFCSIDISPEDHYSCLFDQDSNFYKESCKGKLDYVRPGQKYVVSGRRRNTNCFSLKYQPFKFWSNELSQCVFEKSKCSGIGQILFSNGSFMIDSTCGCDYTEGYAFVTEPRNKCFCIPTEEDCMCYIVNCPRKMQLNQDYMCSYKDNSSTFRCPPIIRSEVESKASTMKGKDEIETKNKWCKTGVTCIIIFVIGVCIVIVYILVGMVIVYKKEIMMTETNKEKQTDKISPEEAVEKTRIIIELLEQLLSNKDFDKDFQEELSAACPNYLNVLQTYKRDLLRNDCGIVIAGETSAGKTTLLNLLVEQNLFVTSNLAATGTVCRIRNSKSMSIKIYTKDEQLINEETADDLNVLKNLIKKYTVVERNPPEMVDVYLPVPILKGNVIIVDTPGIGESENLRDILLDFVPHAVSFVFIINARNAGGIHEDRLLRILKTVIDKRKEMPCFEPEDAIFLTNQWDIIKNIKEDGDEEDEHTKTANKIQNKLEEGWPGFNADRIFKISLEQVRKRQNTQFTKRFKRFQEELHKIIDKNKNKRVEYYFRFIQKFAFNAEMGISSRMNLLEISDDDRMKTLLKTKETIRKLTTVSHEKKLEAKRYKTEVIAKLAKKLSNYLHSDDVRNEILNPPKRKRIKFVPIVSFCGEIFKRINMGISRWCAGEDVTLIIQEIESKMKTLLSDVESMIHIIDEDITGIARSIHDVSCTVFTQSDLRLTLMSNGINFIESLKLLFNLTPEDNRQLAKEKQAHDTYKAWLATFTYDHIRNCFEDNFGTEYDRVISRIFDEEILLRILGVKLTTDKLLAELSDNEKKNQSLTELYELVNEINTKIAELKAEAQL